MPTNNIILQVSNPSHPLFYLSNKIVREVIKKGEEIGDVKSKKQYSVNKSINEDYK